MLPGTREYRFRRDLVKAFLFEASGEGRESVPTDGVLILSSLVKGVIGYLGVPISEEELRVVQPDPFDRGMRISPTREEGIGLFYQWKIAEAAKAGKSLQPRVKATIDRLVKFEWRENAPPDRGGYPNTELYDHLSGGGFGGGILPFSMGDQVELPAPLGFYVEEKVYLKLSGREMGEVQEIGKAMRQHLIKDVEYWQTHKVLRAG